MKCLSCQKKGSHYEKKICPPCKDKGISRDDISVERKSMVFVGNNCGKDADKFVAEELSKKNYSHLRHNFKQHPYDPTKNELKLTWSEYGRGEKTNG